MDEFEYGFGEEQEQELPDEDLEALGITEEALAAERDEKDAAASDFARRNDGHDDEREALHGNSLLWWRDDSLIAAHRAMADLFEEALMDFDRAQLLVSEGVNEETMRIELPLNFLTGPMVVAGLQVLGLFVPEFRSTITQLLKDFPFPVATEEETAEINAAIERLETKARAKAEELVAEIRRRAAESIQAEQDASLGDANLGLGLN